MNSRPDPFEEYAAQNGLRLSTVELSASPRDVLAPPGELERYILATLTDATANTASVYALFVTDAAGPDAPTVRDILWWLSSDSWAIEQAAHDFDLWAQAYNYEREDPGAMRLFRVHLKQSVSLSAVLGHERYAALLSLYERELGTNG